MVSSGGVEAGFPEHLKLASAQGCQSISSLTRIRQVLQVVSNDRVTEAAGGIMFDVEDRHPTFRDCTLEVAELFASVPTVGADGGSLLDLLALRLDVSRGRLQPGGTSRRVVEDAPSQRDVQC